MSLWPKIREGAFSLFYAVVDYDRKIPQWKRDQNENARSKAKRDRIARDAAKASHPSSRPTPTEVVHSKAQRMKMPPQQASPQVVYISTQPPRQTVIVQRSSGCADGCALLILLFILAIGGCVYVGYQSGNSAIERAKEIEKEEKSALPK